MRVSSRGLAGAASPPQHFNLRTVARRAVMVRSVPERNLVGALKDAFPVSVADILQNMRIS